MNPAARLRWAQAAAIGGAVLALIGIFTTWFTVTREGRTIDVPDFGTVPFPPQESAVNAVDLGVGMPASAVILALAAGLAVLGGARTRRVALGLVVFGAVGLIVMSLMTGTGDAIAAAPPANAGLGDPDVSAGAGRVVTLAGAVVALGATGWGLPVTGAREVAMPERGPTGA